jgi:hypothetical protein
MSRRTASALAAVLTSVALHATVREQIEVAAPHGVTEIVVGVSDDRGQPVTGLTRDEFIISSDGVPLRVAAVTAGPSPVSVALLADVSLSTLAMIQLAPSSVMRVRESIPPNVLPVLEPRDRVHIGNIAREFTLTEPVALDRGAWNRALERVVDIPLQLRAGPSPIWDAIGASIQALQGAPGRRGVIVVTDGLASGNRLRLADVLARAIGEGVVIDVVGERVEHAELMRAKARIQLEALIAQLATDSGGQYVEDGPTPQVPRRIPDPGPIVARFITALRQRYVISAEPLHADGQFHPLDVRVTRPGLIVHSPRAYLGRR